MISRSRTFSLVCRQAYVDIVGGGLIYQLGIFNFGSVRIMENYLRVINPAHRACIRSVRLDISLQRKSPIIPPKTLKTLSPVSLPSLRSLEINLYVDEWGRPNPLAHGVMGRAMLVLNEELVEKFKKANWEGMRGNLKVFDLVFKRVYVGYRTVQWEPWVKELAEEIKSRVLGKDNM
jgi:hypothetical protein